MEWNKRTESELVALRQSGCTFRSCARHLNTTLSAVKHKYRRIEQAENKDRYVHTKEKFALFDRTTPFKPGAGISILETNCGEGGLSTIYGLYGAVLAMDNDARKIKKISAKNIPNVAPFLADSFFKVHELVARKERFDIVDLDPYGLPSRFFPHVFSLIDDGMLYLTFPIKGAAQMNKITIKHYDVFWGVTVQTGDDYVAAILSKMADYAFMEKRKITVKEVQKIDRVYRFAIHVEQTSMLELVNLEVNRAVPLVNDRQLDLLDLVG